MHMSGTSSGFRSFIERHSPYPLAVQGVATLALLGTPISALGAAGGPPWGFWALLGIVGTLLLALFLVPARRLPLWAQIVYLCLQLGLATLARACAPAPLLDYVYLAIVLQAIALFRPWLWIPFAVGVWSTWSGGVLLGTAGLWPWLQSNLALAFPATCAIIAAIIYTRQLRRGEQAQQMLQQMQQRYDSLASALREVQHRVALEERERIATALASEVQAALARTEQGVSAALGQAQTNIARLQATVTQARDSAATAVDRLRTAITTLRRGEPGPPPPAGLSAAAVFAGHDEQVIGAVATKVFTWVLPSVFLLLALGLTLVQRRLTPELVAPLLALGTLLMLTYVCTQRVRHPLLLQAGLAGQIVAVLAMTALTHTLPLLLGLLLVLWQVATRLSPAQVFLFLLGAPASAGLLLAQLAPFALDHAALLATGVAAVAVAAPLVLARRQHSRRRQAELRLALLAAEIEQQTSEVRTLAVAAERARVARELHDDLGSQLMLINLQLQLAEELAAESAAAALDQLRGSREQLHAAWRSVLATADAELAIDGPQLDEALERLAAQCRASTQASVGLRVEGPLDDLPPPVAHSIYRAVQEGLTNATKHARPGRIDVQVISESHYVTVTVLNDDRPDDRPPAAPPAHSSFGLVGLRERAEALGGGVEAGPTGDGSWRLRLVLPAEAG